MFWLGWHMFLLSGRSKSTCVVHVGGAAWLYYFRRIVHMDFVIRPRKLHIVFIYCLFSFSWWRWIYLCAHGIDLLGPAGDNPHAIGTGMEKRSETVCHQFLLKSHLELFVIHHTVIILLIYFIYLFYLFIYIFHPHYILYIFFYKLRACIYKFLTNFVPLCICHRHFHHYQYYSLYIFI